jgi:hypothetical protein
VTCLSTVKAVLGYLFLFSCSFAQSTTFLFDFTLLTDKIIATQLFLKILEIPHAIQDYLAADSSSVLSTNILHEPVIINVTPTGNFLPDKEIFLQGFFSLILLL